MHASTASTLFGGTIAPVRPTLVSGGKEWGDLCSPDDQRRRLHMGKRLEGALDELRAAVFEAYAALAEEGAKTGTEQQRRESSLQFIDEILEWRPLATFSATHLELLEMLFAYWRETEVAEDAPVRASLPDPIQ
jgi:hypothetical protein